MLDSVRKEVCVDENIVWGSECGVVLEEEGGGDLWATEGQQELLVRAQWRAYISRTTSFPFSFRLLSISPFSWFFFLITTSAVAVGRQISAIRLTTASLVDQLFF